MATTGLFIALPQHIIIAINKQDLGINAWAFTELIKEREKARCIKVTGTDINANCQWGCTRWWHVTPIDAQDKAANQRQRHVVDSLIPQVFEQLECGAFARAGNARDQKYAMLCSSFIHDGSTIASGPTVNARRIFAGLDAAKAKSFK